MKSIFFKSGAELKPSKIIGIGLNYGKHIEEMKSQRQQEPVIFLKANNAIHDISTAIPIPQGRGAVHHEIELAVCIGREGVNIAQDKVDDYILGYALALDLTLRDKQLKFKKSGLPWALAKGFDAACPVSVFVDKESLTSTKNLQLLLEINDIVRQDGNTAEMLFSIPEIISFVSHYYTLLPGDVILTGTPSGVGPLNVGDTLKASISGIASIETKITAAG